MELTQEQLERLAELSRDYDGIKKYLSKPRRLSYVQFDYDVVHGMTLFMTDPDFSFEALERQIDVILDALPAIKRIFAQPFIHLKDNNVILPVESVRKVDNNTLNHIASHSELWTDIKDGEIKPEKLLTRTYEDNYGIYENLVFCDVVDDVMSFVRTNIRYLKELIYTNRTIEINLLERINHLNYFLALGKLHIGYSRSFEGYYAVSMRCLNKLRFISGSIVPRLKRPVYRNNKKRPANIKIHKTNILSMHKEYHRIYKLAKSFREAPVAPPREMTLKDVLLLKTCYVGFCHALIIFSIGHFNFTCDEKRAFDLARPNMDFMFKGWTLKLEPVSIDRARAVVLTFYKDKPYRIALIPSLDGDETAAEIVKAFVDGDEYILLTPDGGKDAVQIDVTSIESFRRIQQILLRGMIYSDATRDECPFCSDRLIESKDKPDTYECLTCRTVIHEAKCEKTDKPYYYTEISDLKPPELADEEEWLSERKQESAMYFRNITKIDVDMNILCPHCGKPHGNK